MTSRGTTQKQYALRKALLRDHMSAIARVAKADLPPTPEVDAFRTPAGKPTVERIPPNRIGRLATRSGDRICFLDAIGG